MITYFTNEKILENLYYTEGIDPITGGMKKLTDMTSDELREVILLLQKDIDKYAWPCEKNNNKEPPRRVISVNL